MSLAARVAFVSCALVGCGRWGFDVSAGDGDVVSDDDAPDDGSLGGASCEPTPRPVVPPEPDIVIGDGTASSCTNAALQGALDLGGVIGFNCGPTETLITVTQRLLVTKTTTLVGNGLIRLMGDGARVLEVFAPGQTVTVLDLKFKSTDLTGISGAAMFLIDGRVVIIGSEFSSNTTNLSGGAIAGFGPASLDVYDSSFTSNSGANGGAIQFNGELPMCQGSCRMTLVA